jgi:hypothetical protein
MHEVGCEDECCSEKGRKLVQPTIAQIEEWLGEVFYDVKDLPSDLHDQDLFEALRDEGFKVYRKALANLTDPIGREIKAALNQIDQANTPEEKLTAALWASHIQHVHGGIMQDWGERIGFDWGDFERVQQEGIASVFGEETIQEFFEV